MRLVAESSSDRCANTSRDDDPSGTQIAAYPSASSSPTSARTRSAGRASNANVHAPTRPEPFAEGVVL